MEAYQFFVNFLFFFFKAGGVAGVSVDLILFPLDTIKTRLQSPQGFYKAGGFYGVYAGVPSTAIGSFPNGNNYIDIFIALYKAKLMGFIFRIICGPTLDRIPYV